MLAIDTNVVVRYLTSDHPKQAARAEALVERQDVFVATTVLLETEWVLRSAYGFEPRDRKSTRLNSSPGYISYAVFCLKTKTATSQNGSRATFSAPPSGSLTQPATP